MLNVNFPLHGVAVQAGTDTTYRVLKIDETRAMVVRCTRDNVVYPGALPRWVPIEQFKEWSAYDPSTQRPPDPDEF